MTGVEGQASAEYAGLLGARRRTRRHARTHRRATARPCCAATPWSPFSRDRRAEPLPAVAGAADIADVQSAVSGDDALTPDAALLALTRRHGPSERRTISDALVLDAALGAAPWMRKPHAYRAWKRFSDGPYREMPRRSTAIATSSLRPRNRAVAWITVAEQRRMLASLFAHHTSFAALVMDVLPGSAGLKLFRGARRMTQIATDRLPRAVDDLVTGTSRSSI